MPIAAVPAYLQKNASGQDDPEFYLAAPPGHRFLLYFASLGENQETNRLSWNMKDRVPKLKKDNRTGRFEHKGWDDSPNDHWACTVAACKTPPFNEERPHKRRPSTDPGLKPWRPLLAALLTRQQTVFGTTGAEEARLSLKALATAPFTTGLGNEHPLENGFAFLNPYGLPYLPGSGVKGVLRQAARELAAGEWGDRHGWCTDDSFVLRVGNTDLRFSTIDALFGLQSADGASQHLRGALTFWDVIPQIKGDSLTVDIMTPHQGHYYQQKSDKKTGGSNTPHDSGQPIPICFLTLPPGSGFTFHVQCDLAHLNRIAPELATEGRWKAMLEAAFAHAFAWLGFGAKTATGYGAMRIDEAAAARQEKLRLEAEEQAREHAAAEARAAELGAMTPAQRQVREFADECQARHQQHPNVRENPNGVWHGKARALAKAAHESPDWTAEEKTAAADAIEEWLPKLVKVDAKDERKKMKLSALRGVG